MIRIFGVVFRLTHVSVLVRGVGGLSRDSAVASLSLGWNTMLLSEDDDCIVLVWATLGRLTGVSLIGSRCSSLIMVLLVRVLLVLVAFVGTGEGSGC